MNPLHEPNSALHFNFSLLVDVVRHTTLFLLHKYAPNEYLFEDPMNRQHRVKLGKQLTCTCHAGNLGHCIHTLYVLLRIYKLPPDSQYIYMTSYTAADIEKMSKTSEQGFDKKTLIENTLKKEKQITQQKQKVIKQWPKFQIDTVCSICYDSIENKTAIISCHNCQNYFHTKCLKVWVTQRQRQQCELNCPMCRGQLGSLQQVSNRVKEEEKFYIQYHQSHGIQCCECKKQILVKLFKCLLCQKTHLCGDCYLSWKHQKHDKFIGKLSKRGEWQVATRSQFNIKKLNASLDYLKKFGNNGQHLDFQALMGPKYQQFIQSQVQKQSMLDHLLSCFLDVEKQVHKTYKKIDFGEQQLFCCMCRKKNIVGMRRLPCKHFMDEKCLRFVLKGGFLQCPLDKQHFLPGLKGEVVNVI